MFRMKFAHYVFVLLIGWSFFCRDGHSQSVVAYQIEEGVIGNQDFEGPLGMDFIVNSTITVDSLGAFDSESDGFNLPITVELWSRDDLDTPDDLVDDDGLEILASAEFEEGETGTAIGGSRFLTLAEPVVLEPGPYTIVGVGYGAGESNYNVGGRDAELEGLTVFDTELITFVGGSRFGDAGIGPEAFPLSVDGGPVNRYGAGTFTFVLEDSDGDGAPDAWEEANGLDKDNEADGAMDLDEDGVSNVEEYNRGTDPGKADTDGDGLNDKMESGTGIWVSEDDRGTDPLIPDSDDDGLGDAVETNSGTFVDAANPGTSPVNADTDGDGFGDSREINEGTNPVDKSDFPAPGDVSGEVAINVEDGRTGNQAFGGGLGIDFIVNRPIRILELGAFDDGSDGFNTEITVELWSRDEEDFGLEILATTVFSAEEPGDVLEGYQFRDLDSPIILEPGPYTIVGWGYNADEMNGNDGNAGNFPTDQTESDAIEFVGGSRFGNNGGDFPDTPDGGPEVRYGAGSFTFDEGSSAPFEITGFVFDQLNRSITVEWNSSATATYAVAFSSDLKQWIELEDGLAADGESTEFTEEGIPPDAAVRYYRVREE